GAAIASAALRGAGPTANITNPRQRSSGNALIGRSFCPSAPRRVRAPAEKNGCDEPQGILRKRDRINERPRSSPKEGNRVRGTTNAGRAPDGCLLPPWLLGQGEEKEIRGV